MYKCFYCGNVFNIASEIDWHVAGDEFMCGGCYEFTQAHDLDIQDDDDDDDDNDEHELLDWVSGGRA